MYSITVNNKEVILSKRVSVLEACRQIGIEIPRYCYHESLSIAGNCRMCIVELKNSPKPLIACATPITNGMSIFTDSPLVKKARESTLEFLLLNHPLDCPVCDQGGECDLQDQAFSFGSDQNRFYSFKRAVKDKNLGPIVKTVMTRCIHCTRCVRFAIEVAGIKDLGTFGRGMETEIGTYVNKTFNSELSGNLIDLCPVGALTGKPYPFVSRSWELKTYKTIDFTDGFFDDINVLVKNNRIIKILPYFNFSGGNKWISDKTRFAFDSLFSNNRIPKLMINSSTKNKLSVLKLSWEKLFKEIIVSIYFLDYLTKHFNKQLTIVLLLGANLSMEVLGTLFLLEKKYFFFKVRKLNNLQLSNDFDHNYILDKNFSTALDNSNLCVLIGLNTRYESPTLNLELKKRYQLGSFNVVNIGSYTNFTFPVESVSLNNVLSIAEGTHTVCKQIKLANNPIFIVGSSVYNREDNDTLLTLIKNIKKLNETSSINSILSLGNEVAALDLNIVKSVSVKDLQDANGFFLLGTAFNHYNTEKLIETCLFKRLLIEKNKIILGQNSINSFDDLNCSNSLMNIPFRFSLCSNNFFEETGTFVSQSGQYKKAFKIISAVDNSKKILQILRGFSFYLSKINYLEKNSLTNLFQINDFHENQYSGFHLLPNFNFNTFFNFTSSKNFNYLISSKNYRNSTKKLFNSKLNTKVDDFYTVNYDNFNVFSKVMNSCSLQNKKNVTNFSNLR